MYHLFLNYLLFHQSWKRQIRLKCWYVSNKISDVKCPKTVLFTQQATIKPNVTYLLLSTLAWHVSILRSLSRAPQIHH
jgi:hypothetical protein